MTDESQSREVTVAKPQLVAGAHVAAIVPRSLEETFRVATAIHASGMAPSSFSKPEQIMVAIMAGAELGFAPFQALQSIAVINGRPSVWGDGLLALVLSQGFKVREWCEGEGEAMVAHCEVTRPDNESVHSAQFSVADAKKANLWSKRGPWQEYPARMLKMRARAFAIRDGAADVLRGFQIREEVEDYNVRDVTPQPSGLMERLKAGSTGAEDGYQSHHVATALDAEVAQDATETEIADLGFSEGLGDAVEAEPEHEAETVVETDEAQDDSILNWAVEFNQGLGDWTDADKLKNEWAGLITMRDRLKTASEPIALALHKSVIAKIGELRS